MLVKVNSTLTTISCSNSKEMLNHLAPTINLLIAPATALAQIQTLTATSQPRNPWSKERAEVRRIRIHPAQNLPPPALALHQAHPQTVILIRRRSQQLRVKLRRESKVRARRVQAAPPPLPPALPHQAPAVLIAIRKIRKIRRLIQIRKLRLQRNLRLQRRRRRFQRRIRLPRRIRMPIRKLRRVLRRQNQAPPTVISNQLKRMPRRPSRSKPRLQNQRVFQSQIRFQRRARVQRRVRVSRRVRALQRKQQPQLKRLPRRKRKISLTLKPTRRPRRQLLSQLQRSLSTRQPQRRQPAR